MRSMSFLFLLLSLFFVKSSQGQSNEILIQGQTGKLFVEHTVVAKENWYSIGRLYNLSPKEIAPYNSLTMDKPLSIGQQLQIPLTAANFSQNGQKTAAETLVPVYHIVQDKEWMYRVSVNHNKVPVSNLEKWNSVNKDQVKSGMHLIVGYLKVKTALSAFAAGGGGASVAVAPSKALPVPAATAPSAATTPSVTTSAGNSPASSQPVTKVTSKTKVDPASVKEENNPNSSAPAGTYPVTKENNPANSQGTDNTPATATKTVSDSKTVSAAPGTPTLHFNGGYFKPDFTESGKTVSGMAGTFKSTSGWHDGKYYALMNNVPVGLIVKILIPSTNRIIFAKVLGQLPDMKESTGLTVRISNAAAGELGEGDGKFNVEIKY
ncbi:LysM peptidoglycan-binding domain-containing protein [Flavitalea flava]